MLVKRTMPGLFGLLVMWLASAGAVWLTAELLAGVHLRGFAAALGVALVLGLVNTLVRPLLVLLTLPVTFLTLGLFLLVINAAVVGLVAWFLPGFTVDGFWDALLAALVLSVVSTVIGWLLPEGRKKRARG